MKLKEVIIYAATVAGNTLLSFLINFLLFGDSTKHFVLVMCGVILLSMLVTFVIASKFDYKLDIYAYNITDLKYLILNSIFIGSLFSIPLSMFISLLL